MVNGQLSQHETEANDRVMFGFWVYLMTDLLMFSVLFAVYAVLQDNTFGSETGRQLFRLPMVLTETIILLTSSFTCGLGMIAVRQTRKFQTLAWFSMTFVLGLTFLIIELHELASLVHAGHTPQSNAFLSSFFVLVGTHGLHIFFGIVWMITTLIFVIKRGLNVHLVRKLSLLSLYWHFLDIIWIFIFTIVYLGAFK